MSFFRTIFVFLAGLAIAMASLGFAAQASLHSGEQFTQDMNTALADPAVNAEIKQAIQTEVTAAIQKAAQGGNILGQLGATFGSDAIASQAANVVDTEVFTRAWSDWSSLLFQGLADYAYQRPNDNVSVAGNNIIVAVAPLLQPVVGSGVTAQLADALVDPNQTVTITSEANLGAILTGVGHLVELRWALLAIGVGLALLVFLMGGRRLLWLALTLAWIALVVVALAGVVTFVQEQAGQNPQMPALTQAITAALTHGWTLNLLLVGAGVGLLAVVFASVASATRNRNVAA